MLYKTTFQKNSVPLFPKAYKKVLIKPQITQYFHVFCDKTMTIDSIDLLNRGIDGLCYRLHS